jgi:GTP-binding protein
VFVDEVDIIVRAGKGGDGCVSFLREKYRPIGKPAGGNGGRGGSIIFQADPGLRTLADFRGHRILVAKAGQPGEGKNRHGKSAKNLLVRVPVGTVIKDMETGEIVFDLVKPMEKVVVAQGGQGGRGNACFATPTNRSPRKFQKGTPGEDHSFRLELRLLADIGLVGLPNAGKSTLVSVISTVRPKIADYPFTTLRPSVGVVRLGDFVSFTVADIPGLIELAHEGKGLGHQFLRHIRRTSTICHLVEFPPYEEDTVSRFNALIRAYRTIRRELEAYDDELAAKPEIVVFTKADILPEQSLHEFVDTYIERFIAETGCAGPVMVVSAVRGDGISDLLGLLAKRLGLDGKPAEAGLFIEYAADDEPETLRADELSMETLDVQDSE